MKSIDPPCPVCKGPMPDPPWPSFNATDVCSSGCLTVMIDAAIKENEAAKKKRQQAKKSKTSGVPIDGNDWTVEDWKYLHAAMNRVKARIAARHRDK